MGIMLQYTAGQESWTDHTAKMHVFVISPDLTKETPMHVAAGRPLPSGALTGPVANRDPRINVISSNRHVARNDAIVDMGFWSIVHAEIEEGTILKVFASKKGQTGEPLKQASRFIRVREGAAIRNVLMAMSRIGTVPNAYLSGRFDLISYDESVALGLPILAHFKQFHEDIAVRRLFTDTIEQPEASAYVAPSRRRVRVRNDQNQEVTIFRSFRRRNLQLD